MTFILHGFYFDQESVSPI